MRSNLYQSRDAFLYTSILWLALAAAAAQNLYASAFAFIFALIAIMLYFLAAPGELQSTAAAYLLGLGALAAGAIAALVGVSRLGVLNGITGAAAVLASWLLTVAAALWFYNRLIIVPNGVLHVYTGFIGSWTVKGYAKIAPPPAILGRLRATVPVKQLKLNLDVAEIGTLQKAAPNLIARRVGDTGPPDDDGRAGISNIHRMRMSIICSIQPERWRELLRIPCDGLVSRLRTQHGGRGAWLSQEYWSDIVRGYVEEVADEQTRRVVYESGLSTLNIWQHQDAIADRIFERLVVDAEPYGISINFLDIVEVAVDEPGALRRTRDMALLGGAWQQQQSQLLETFHASLRRLGLQLSAKEIEQITRTHLRELMRDLQHYGHLDYIVSELVADSNLPPTNGSPSGGRPPFRKVA